MNPNINNYKQVTKEEILQLPKGDKYYCYNPLTDTKKKKIVGKNDIAHNKYAYAGLKYYLESKGE